MIRKEAIVAILGSPVAYYTAFARVLGGVEAGILTSQFFYWFGKGHNPEGWIYKTQAEIEDETGLTRRNQETARKKLRELGVLEEQYAGMPAKLYYRLNLDNLFALVNEWFTATFLSKEATPDVIEEESSASRQDGGIRQSRMYESANQGWRNPPTKDVQTRQPRMYESAIQASTNPPTKDGGTRHTNTKTTTTTTTESTPKNTSTTTVTPAPPLTSQVDVDVTVLDHDLPQWLMDEFHLLLGSKRRVNAADRAALNELAYYPKHIIEQALDAAHAWLDRPDHKPIHSLARWLLGTAQRKWEAEQQRGNTVTALVNEDATAWTADVEEMRMEPRVSADTSTVELLPQMQVWNSVLQELALQVPTQTYDSWLRDTVVLSVTEDEYRIGLPNAQAKDWVENRLARVIKRILASLAGHPVSLRFQVLESGKT